MAAITINDFASFLGRDNVTQKKAFGMPGLFVNGNMFLAVTDKGVSFKLDAAGMEKAYTYTGASTMPMKGWVELPPDTEADWLDLAELAYAYVASLPAKQPKKKG
jgi:TfoX/Sxy family transcriptional regulator of competence genes